MHFLGFLALLPGDGAQEPNDVVGEVVLDGRAVTNGVDVAQRGTNHTKMGISF